MLCKRCGEAQEVLSGVVVDTPLEYDHYLSGENTKQRFHLKKETRNESASFKICGAYYAISSTISSTASVV